MINSFVISFQVDDFVGGHLPERSERRKDERKVIAAQVQKTQSGVKKGIRRKQEWAPERIATNEFVARLQRGHGPLFAKRWRPTVDPTKRVEKNMAILTKV